VLLREIHHRVKNNMQVISSLLSLQSEKVADPEVRMMYKESQDRILSMSLVHETLYQSENLAVIDFMEYIRSFATRLYSSYGVDTDRIRLWIEAEPVQLGIEQAVPCGLIIHELLSNALKHAFPAGKKEVGQVSILLRHVDNDIELIIRDDGIGLSDEIQLRKVGSLGMKLVSVLTDQLQAKITVRRDQGTEYKIRFSPE
jgi:two-component sensor histidine kinase